MVHADQKLLALGHSNSGWQQPEFVPGT